MQPTPEIESKGTFGEGLEATDDVVSTDDGIGEENSENDATTDATGQAKTADAQASKEDQVSRVHQDMRTNTKYC